MHQTRKGRIKNRSYVLERITLENMRRMLIASLVFVLLFFIEWLVMCLGRDAESGATGFYIAMAVIPGLNLAFAGVTLYRMWNKNTSGNILMRSFWIYTTIASFSAVFLIDNQFSVLMKMGALAIFLALIPLFNKTEFITSISAQLAGSIFWFATGRVDGEHFVYLICAQALCGVISRQAYYAFQRKVEDATKLNSAKNLAETDPMTTLLNRRGLERRIAHVWPLCVRQGMEVAVIMLDIDNFKKYNDHFGHSAGDECIRAVAKAIKEHTKRKTDYCARVGGEEFLIFLNGLSAQDALLWAQGCKKAVEELVIPHAPDNFLPYVTMSMGIAHVQVNGSTEFWELRNEADRNLYKAKEAGRACIFMKDNCYAKTSPELSKKQYFMERGFRSIG